MNGKPGKRFQEYYLRRHFAGRGRMRKLLVVATAMVLFAAGIFFLAVPGPGILILLLGASMIAEESYLAARVFDWIEIQIRRLVEQGVRVWKRSRVFKGLIILVTAVTAGAAGWAAYSLIFEP